MSNGLNQLVVDLERAAKEINDVAETVFEVGANNIKDDARKAISGLPHAPHYPRSITYDVKLGLRGITAEIGPDKNLPQGALGNLLEHGSVNNPPNAHLGPALDREVPAVRRHLGTEAVSMLV